MSDSLPSEIRTRLARMSGFSLAIRGGLRRCGVTIPRHALDEPRLERAPVARVVEAAPDARTKRALELDGFSRRGEARLSGYFEPGRG